jgi:hypothetical protein
VIVESSSTSATLPSLLTRDELISYLRLDVDERDPAERLRNLVRRQGLPAIKRGRLQLFKLADVNAWLDGTLKNKRGKT